MAGRIREHDWAVTKLGPPDRWSSSLKVMVRMALTTRHPIFIFWGREHTCFYTDAYSPSLGPEKHPSIFGAPGREAWHEIWHIIGPQIEFVMRGEGATGHENHFVPFLRNGAMEEVYWTCSYGPIDDESAPNGVGGVLVVCNETTHQVMAERVLVNERERFAWLLEQAPSFMAFLQGPEHLVDLANRGYVKLIGHRPILGRTIAEALPDAVAQGYLRLLDKVYASGEAVTASGARYVDTGLDATEVERFADFVYQPIKDLAGHVTGIFVQAVDVTDHLLGIQALSNAQSDLHRSEEQLRLATDAGEVGPWDGDLISGTLFTAARVKAMFGVSPDIPLSLADFSNGLHPDDQATTTAAFALAMDPVRRSVHDVEHRTVGKEDGIIRWIAAKGRALFDEDGRCTRVLGTAIDITRRKTTEASLKESQANLIAAVEALKEADRNKDLFLATLGHELRNPLATLPSALTLMERAPGNVAMNFRTRQIMGRRVDQLVRLTDDLLDVSRIRLGKINLRCEVLALNLVLAQAAESCMPAIELAGQHLVLQIPDSPALVYGDPARLVQVLGNLIGNASKFTPVGGQIDVVARLDGRSIVTSVKDSGIGPAADKLVCVFEPFTQFENPAGRSNTGLGIGLALAKQLVQRQGGDIEARSAGIGQGGEFIVRLPLHDAI